METRRSLTEVMKVRPLIVKLAKMLTDCMDARLGLVRMDETRWEYKMLDTLLTDEMAELMLKMGRRRPTTAAELAKKTGWDEARIQKLLDELAEIARGTIVAVEP